MLIHRFTRIIRSKGWTVEEACEYWKMRTATYNARCNNPKLDNQLESMCRGLEDRLNEET